MTSGNVCIVTRCSKCGLECIRRATNYDSYKYVCNLEFEPRPEGWASKSIRGVWLELCPTCSAEFDQAVEPIISEFTVNQED